MSAVTLATFGAQTLRAYNFRGRLVMVAADLARVLGYAEPKKVASQIRTAWWREFHEGQHFEIFSGGKLSEFRRLEFEVPGSGTSNRDGSIRGGARVLMVLYEPGINLVLLKSEATLAARVRAWLASEVLPALARDGTYSKPTQAQPKAAPELPPATRTLAPTPIREPVPIMPPPLPADPDPLRTVTIQMRASAIDVGRHAAEYANLPFDAFVESSVYLAYYSMRASGRFGSLR